MFTYKVQVDLATHDMVGRGIFDQSRVFVRVAADSDVDAVLLACQMAHTMAPFDMMPTGALLLDFPV